MDKRFEKIVGLSIKRIALKRQGKYEEADKVREKLREMECENIKDMGDEIKVFDRKEERYIITNMSELDVSIELFERKCEVEGELKNYLIELTTPKLEGVLTDTNSDLAFDYIWDVKIEKE